MAEPEAAKTKSEQQTDAASGPSGDAALKAIAHLQEVAETLAADAAKLARDEAVRSEPAKTENAKSEPVKSEAGADKAKRRIQLPALSVAKDGTKPKPQFAAKTSGWRAKARAWFEQVVWAQTVAAAVLTLAVAGGAYLGLMDYLDRRETQRLAAEDLLRKPVETPAEREMRAKIADLSRELQALRGQMGKVAGEARAAHTQAAATAATAQNVARVEKAEKELATKLDQHVARIERLERLAADPIVTSSIPKGQKGTTVAAQAPKPGLRTPDPSMKPNTFVLRSVRNGVAMVQTRGGMLEVGPGDVIPGVGRVRAIEKMDGRWVLVMHDGYIDQYDD